MLVGRRHLAPRRGSGPYPYGAPKYFWPFWGNLWAGIRTGYWASGLPMHSAHSGMQGQATRTYSERSRAARCRVWRRSTRTLVPHPVLARVAACLPRCPLPPFAWQERGPAKVIDACQGAGHAAGTYVPVGTRVHHWAAGGPVRTGLGKRAGVATRQERGKGVLGLAMYGSHLSRRLPCALCHPGGPYWFGCAMQPAHTQTRPDDGYRALAGPPATALCPRPPRALGHPVAWRSHLRGVLCTWFRCHTVQGMLGLAPEGVARGAWGESLCDACRVHA